MAAQVRRVNACDGEGLLPLTALRASNFQRSPGLSKFGAGEGNRTLVVSLEGFCSTIELHPRERSNAIAAVRASTACIGLTAGKPLAYQAIRMTNLVAIAASSTARRWWWRSCTLAARWRD